MARHSLLRAARRYGDVKPQLGTTRFDGADAPASLPRRATAAAGDNACRERRRFDALACVGVELDASVGPAVGRGRTSPTVVGADPPGWRAALTVPPRIATTRERTLSDRPERSPRPAIAATGAEWAGSSPNRDASNHRQGRSRRSESSARAAARPLIPCTAPPGCVEAPAMYRPGSGVRYRASSGAGRKTSCWSSS
jgi:hypothetical protein